MINYTVVISWIIHSKVEPKDEKKNWEEEEAVIRFLGSLKVSHCYDTWNLRCEDKRLQNCLEDLATKLDDWRFEFLTGKIWLLSVINCEDDSLWCLPQNWFISIKIVKQKIFTWFLGKLSTKSAFSMVHLCCFQEVLTLVFVQTSWWFSHVFRKKWLVFWCEIN